MQKVVTKKFLFVFLLTTFLFPLNGYATDLASLFKDVEQLNLKRGGYILGAKLTKEQIEIAKANPIKAEIKDTLKFQDKNLFIVVQATTNRVIVIYEKFEDASQKIAQNVVGDLYMEFDEPTVLAHDKIVYWAYEKEGKISNTQFDKAKDDNKKLGILATVKFSSDMKIMEEKEASLKGYIYYIISSDPILKYFGKSNS